MWEYNYLEHSSHKYIYKKRINGKWRYYYNPVTKKLSTTNTSSIDNAPGSSVDYDKKLTEKSKLTTTKETENPLKKGLNTVTNFINDIVVGKDGKVVNSSNVEKKVEAGKNYVEKIWDKYVVGEDGKTSTNSSTTTKKPKKKNVIQDWWNKYIVGKEGSVTTRVETSLIGIK